MIKYQTIYADPCWKFNNAKTGGSMKSGADAHYPTMSIGALMGLDVEEITDTDCVLFMWWVASMPKEAIKLAEAWGFTIKTMTAFNWIKTTKKQKLDFGMGFWTRAGSECCLVATKGKPKRIDAGVRSVVITEEMEEIILAPKGRHSEKPPEVRNRIVQLMGDVPRLEMFARVESPGWHVFGNEVENSIKILNL